MSEKNPFEILNGSPGENLGKISSRITEQISEKDLGEIIREINVQFSGRFPREIS